jgi:hypothetical protein
MHAAVMTLADKGRGAGRRFDRLCGFSSRQASTCQHDISLRFIVDGF